MIEGNDIDDSLNPYEVFWADEPVAPRERVECPESPLDFVGSGFRKIQLSMALLHLGILFGLVSLLITVLTGSIVAWLFASGCLLLGIASAVVKWWAMHFLYQHSIDRHFASALRKSLILRPVSYVLPPPIFMVTVSLMEWIGVNSLAVKLIAPAMALTVGVSLWTCSWFSYMVFLRRFAVWIGERNDAAIAQRVCKLLIAFIVVFVLGLLVIIDHLSLGLTTGRRPDFFRSLLAGIWTTAPLLIGLAWFYEYRILKMALPPAGIHPAKK
ncbi:MAG: hypothetical protein AAF958_18265 [Planctomycetota bacterium]